MDARSLLPRDSRRTATRVGVAACISAVLLAGCGNASKPTARPTDSGPTGSVDRAAPPADRQSRLVLGTPEPGLAFTVPALGDEAGDARRSGPALVAGDQPTEALAGDAQPQSGTQAVGAFGRAVVEGRTTDAFALLPNAEQTRLGSAIRFADLLSREPIWKSATVDPASSTDAVAAILVTQTPAIDEIRGVVAPAAIVTLPTRKEADGWKVSWERRTTTQQFGAADSRATDDVVAWATARQQRCGATDASSAATPPGEHAGGLLGALWLADELCTTPAPVAPTEVGDIYTLDDPQALLDAYGGGAYQWARVVTLAAPHAMHVIVAPLDDRWVVVGLAPVLAT